MLKAVFVSEVAPMLFFILFFLFSVAFLILYFQVYLINENFAGINFRR